ncbi:AMP-dependent synthetase [Roseobacter denitrificans]|uniref:AMP-binding domain protein n=1 Tax=Roseobacter denitrificans (strain ATCC 33942 / OCh 114) TaxID=375451 RepID=Q165G8_ROSDO|nr:AMP-binding protein [Roseobacter denitrificans]ABG32375.1 AMP-binding domain protein [Roseobacter denitrificans OCh 114]AVL51847.1 AMP-dependent synthetase [Roseobacter denitrificans]SFF81018.1 long-chain acyl-CoA synthetase [Roseobacter denitrificans OCh 114]
MNLAHWLERQAQITPGRPALFLGTECVADYGQFWRDARAVAGWLLAQGVGSGDRVALFMTNVPDYLTVFYGIWAVGAAAVPINAKLHGREAAFILENSGAKHVFTSPELSASLIEAGVSTTQTEVPGTAFEAIRAHEPIDVIVPRDPDDLAWLFYTSGTTGKPKGVMITHRMLSVMSLCYVTDIDPVSPEDATIYAAPMSHGAGIYNMIHVRAGARHVCPPSGGFDPDEILTLAQHFGNAHLFAAPTMVNRLTQYASGAGQRGEGLRTIIYAGGPMYNADIIAAVDHFGPVFIQIYGQGECPMGITALSRADVTDRTHADWARRLQSVGRAQSAVEVAIGDENGKPLTVGEHGEIMVRGDTVMPGYWTNPEATAKTLLNGWLMTGDMGFMSADGYLTLQDRSKDMIITGGSNVYPREVEEVLLRDSGVTEVSVVGRPHAEWGEEVVAFVVGDVDPARLDQLCLDHMARFKRPKEYVKLEALPKNNYGKILKTELRALLTRS